MNPLCSAFRLLPALFLLTSSLVIAETIPPGWFVWPSPEPIEGSALDLRSLNDKPAGSHGRIQVRDGHFVAEDGTRLRFWGCNISSNENFPDAEAAKRLARRLAQGGVNIARLHHLDNPWSVESRGSLWTPGQAGRIVIDAAQLDKLHCLVAALKAEGIYSDVNLKVSRTFGPDDGFPASIAQCPPFQKRVDYFLRRMIDLQKDYARRLLSVKNPYTGLSLAEDPAVAVVEINNENSLLGMRTRDVGTGLDLLPEPFRGDLAGQWTRWLKSRYTDDAALRAAWAKGATPVGGPLISADSRWHVEAQPGNELVMDSTADLSSLHVRLTKSDGVRWRSAVYLDRLDLREGETCTLSFRMRADRQRAVIVAVGRDDASWRTDKWRTYGLNSTLNIGPDWTSHRLVFNAHSVVDLGSRLTFMAGHALGEVWIEGLKLESGSASAGLQKGDSLVEGGQVGIPTDATPAQWTDWLTFLSDTEQAYVAEMRAYLRDELKLKAPLVCSQANYGGMAGLLRERSMDFIDSHCYWQHPDFGGASGAWNMSSWIILNTPQLAEFSGRWFGELGGISLLRVAGKPFTVTELDHPAPTEYACEMYPVLASFASLQDWDGLFPFDSVEMAVEKDAGRIGTFFDQRHHPAKWGFAPFATRIFRQGLVPALSARRELQVPADFWGKARHLDVLWLRNQPGQDLGFLTDRLSVNEKLLPAGSPVSIIHEGMQNPGAVRLAQGPAGPVYLLAAPEAAAIVGYCGGGTTGAGPLLVKTSPFGLNFAAITAVSLDGKALEDSGRILVSLIARANNQGMQWNKERSSVGGNWGHGPTIAEQVPAVVKFVHAGSLHVFPLAPDGSRLGEIPVRVLDGGLEFSTTAGPATLHYELVR